MVDLIIEETRSRATESSSPGTPQASMGLPGYEPEGYDEAVLPDGRPRASHAAVLELLAGLPTAALRHRAAALEREKSAAGVVFRATGQEKASTFPVDFVPRILTGEEWSRLQGGTAQRARALEAFVADVYGEGAAVRDGIVPAWLVQRRRQGSGRPATRRRPTPGASR